MADFPQTDWSRYFDSGQNFGNWFNSQLQQQQKLRFEQARAIIDDEFQRQRLGQQQQQVDQTGDYYKQLGQQALKQQELQAAGQAETKRHNLVNEAPDKEMTPADWQKMFLGYAGPQGGQMPIGSALSMMKGTPGVTVSPEQEAAAMGSAGKVQGPSPVNMGMNIMGSLANSLGGVPGGPNLPTTEMQVPPPDQAFLPGTQEAMQAKEALAQQRNQRSQLMKIQGEKLVEGMKLAGDAATINRTWKESQTALNDARTSDLKEKGPWQRFMQGENLKVRQAELEINRMRTQIYGKSVTERIRKETVSEANKTRSFMNTELGRINSERTAIQREKDGLQTAIAKTNSIIVEADEMAKEAIRRFRQTKTIRAR